MVNHVLVIILLCVCQALEFVNTGGGFAAHQDAMHTLAETNSWFA
jgi:hypothetical protein